MFSNNKYIVLFGLVALVNLTTPLKLYLATKELLNPKLNGNQRQPNSKTSKHILPLNDLLKHLAQTKGNQYNLPHDKYDCMPGKICITKTRHNEDNLIINNALRSPESSHESEEYVEYSDDYDFNDMTRLQGALKNDKQAENSRRRQKTAEDIDAEDLLRMVKNTVAFADYNPNPRTLERTIAKKYRLNNKNNRKHLRTVRRANSYESNSDSSYSNSDSDENTKRKRKSSKKDDRAGGFGKVPKRFEVVDNGKKSKHNAAYSSGEKYQSEEVTKSKKKSKKKYEKKEKDKKEMYMQAGRLVKVGRWSSDEDDGFRRRLPHFLPKRYHWDEDDFKHLGFYWFHGPQGKYPGIYKIGY